MIVLDTDAVSHLQKMDPVGILVAGRLGTSPDREVRITAVTAYEIMGEAAALVDRRKKQHGDLVPALRLLQDLAEYLGAWRGLILPYDLASDRTYRQLPARIRQELKDDARIARPGEWRGRLDLQRGRLL